MEADYRSGRALDELADLTKSRCAFCERRASIRIYRFRPPGYAEPTQPVEGKDSYLWLAFASVELSSPSATNAGLPGRTTFRSLAIAPLICHRGGSKDPGLKLDEQPLLLFPGELVQPWTSFQVTARGELLGNEKRAVATIMQYNLNRPELITARASNLDALVRSLVAGALDTELPDSRPS